MDAKALDCAGSYMEMLLIAGWWEKSALLGGCMKIWHGIELCRMEGWRGWGDGYEWRLRKQWGS